jgi:D-xylose 1-dehydrogenase (NADP+, D-xylono-1,5-lactone-forming)
MAAKFKWGLLSTARINHAILGGMAHSERGEVVAVGSRDKARAEAYAAAKGLARAYGSYEELLADPDIQIIYNPLPNDLHKEWTIKALQAGKHVLCEKPFAISLPEVDAMFDTARSSGHVVAEAFMYRHHPKILKLKELVDDGSIGEPILLRSAHSFRLDRENDIRWDPARGGGSLWDMGCYPVSLALYLFGAPERVQAWQKRAAAGVDGTLAASLYHRGDRVSQIDCSFQVPFRSQAEVVGTEGVITLVRPFQPSAPESSLSLRRGDREETIELANPPMYWLEIEDMHDAILTGAGPRITPAETRAHIETILQLYAAARS